jgi:hypothetical protein
LKLSTRNIIQTNVSDYVGLKTEILNQNQFHHLTNANENLTNLFNPQNVAQLGAGQLPLFLLRLFPLRLLSVYPDQPGSLPTNNRAGDHEQMISNSAI